MENIYFDLNRLESNKNETLGELFKENNPHRLCYIIEDEFRTEKVMGETRIPAGIYEIKYRLEGGHHVKYGLKQDLKQLGYTHKGMLHLQSVPNFKHILIHIGNTDEDTEGCLLLNTSFIRDKTKVPEKIKGTGSTLAYVKVYMEYITPELDKGNKVFIRIHDEPVNKRGN